MNDFHFAVRMLLKKPGFTAVAVVTLALGIGVNTSMFSMLQATMMRPLPYPEADRLVRLFGTSPSSRTWPHSVVNFVDYRTQSQAFEHMAAFAGAAFNLAEPGQPAERLRGLQVSVGIFPLLGIQPTFGRWFSADEEQAGRNGVAILGHRFWLSRFAGDTNILGRTLRLDGEPITVVGVMPAGLNDPRLSGSIEVWRPIVFADNQRQNRGVLWLDCVARLKPGVSLAQAQAEMDTLTARLAKGYPDSNSGIGVRLVPLAVSDNENGRRIVWLISSCRNTDHHSRTSGSEIDCAANPIPIAGRPLALPILW
jgi:putative ABC transport system permease protein